ncbi:solute carrier family 35 member G1-like [Glandiceps talaboti]
MLANGDRNGNSSPISNSGGHREDRGIGSPCLGKLKELQGILLALVTGVLFSTATTLVTAVEIRGISAFQILFLAYLSILVIALSICLLRNNNVLIIGARNIIILLCMGFFRWLALTFVYYAFKLLPFGDVIAVVRGLVPVLTALAALVFLHERWSLVEIVVTLFNVAGVVVVAGPVFLRSEEDYPDSDPDQHWTPCPTYNKAVGFSLAVGCGVSFSLCYILARSLKDSFTVSCRLVYDSSVGLLLSTIFLYATSDRPMWLMGSKLIVTLLLYVTVENVALYAFYRSFKVEAAATVSMILNIELVTTYIYQATMFAVKPGALQITGAVLIICSSAIVVIIKWRSHSKEDDTEREAVLQEFSDGEENAPKFGSLQNRD